MSSFRNNRCHALHHRLTGGEKRAAENKRPYVAPLSAAFFSYTPAAFSRYTTADIYPTPVELELIMCLFNMCV